jgi:hypothetical protein
MRAVRTLSVKGLVDSSCTLSLLHAVVQTPTSR